MIVTLKEFCEQTGFPKKMIKAHAKSGLLPYIPCGRRYLFDKEETLKKLELLKAVPINTPQPQRTRCQNVKKMPTGYVSIKDYFKAKMAKRKTAGAATPTVTVKD